MHALDCFHHSPLRNKNLRVLEGMVVTEGLITRAGGGKSHETSIVRSPKPTSLSTKKNENLLMKPFSNLGTFNKPFRLKLLWWVVGGLTGSWTINSLQCFGQILGTHFNSYRPAPHEFSRTLGDRLANVFCELAEWSIEADERNE